LSTTSGLNPGFLPDRLERERSVEMFGQMRPAASAIMGE